MTTWLEYQSQIRDADKLFRDLHGIDQQRKQQLQQTTTTLAQWNKNLTAQQERIRDIAERLTLRRHSLERALEQATPPQVKPGGVEQDLNDATSESTACDQTLADLEKQASKSPFLPEWSDTARTTLIGLVFSVLPVLAIMDIQITGFWTGILWLIWWGIATWITGIGAAMAHGILCTPPLRKWDELADGNPILRAIDTAENEFIAFVVFAAPSTLIMLYKIFTTGTTGLRVFVIASAVLAFYKIFLD